MGLFPRALTEYLSLVGIPRAKGSKIFIVDTELGSDSNPGTTFDAPLKSVAAALALCTADKNDVVLMVARDTADNPAAAINWNKDYTHLVGMSADLPGLGQRCRIVGTAAADLTQVITFAGNGCIVKNVQIYNGADADVDSGAAIVTGDRCHFKNVFFAGMGHATPGARAGSWSLKLTGAAENFFEDCTIGLDTILRAAANAELVMATSSKNLFRRCRFMSYSETAGKFMVNLDTAAAGLNSWEDCLFYSQSVNWAAPIDNAFKIAGAGATHYVDLCRCRLVGIDGWADVVTRVYTSDPAPNAGAGVPTNPTT